MPNQGAIEIDVSEQQRPIRSYVLRAGRLTAAQDRALSELLPIFQLEPERDLAGTRPVHVEVGFGNGEQLGACAEAAPEALWLGIEVHPPGVGALLQQIEQRELDNVRILMADAAPFFAQTCPAGRIASVRVLFPDPWPKKRHHKRRLIQPDFVRDVARVLKPGGDFFLATDWQPYAEHMLEVLEAEAALENMARDGFCPRPEWRIASRFERRGRDRGHQVFDLHFRRGAVA